MKRKDPPKPQRNALCACGSGKKYKKCHLLIEREEAIKAEREWEERRKARALEIQKQRENDADTRRAQGLNQTHGSRVNPWILSALAMAAMTSPSTKRSRFL